MPKVNDNNDNSEITAKSGKKAPRGRPFKKGESGNPDGRPVGAVSFKTALIKEAERQITLLEKKTKKKYQITVNEAIAKKVVEMSINGNIKAIELYVERMDGKVTQPVDANIQGKIIMLPSKNERRK